MKLKWHCNEMKPLEDFSFSFFFKNFIYLKERALARENMNGLGRSEEEGEADSCPAGCPPDAGLDTRILRS